MKGKYFGKLDENQQKTGFATFVYPHSFTYAGSFFQDLKSGPGKISLGNGLLFNGNFEKGQINGFGELNIAGISKYTGNFLDGERHGKGKFVSKSVEFEGEFFQGVFHGKGSLKDLKSGFCFEGEFDQGKMKGVFSVRNERGREIYRGELREKKKEGQGVVFDEGWAFSGTFKDDVPVNGSLKIEGIIDFRYLGLMDRWTPKEKSNAYVVELMKKGEKGERGWEKIVAVNDVFKLEIEDVFAIKTTALFQGEKVKNHEFTEQAAKKNPKIVEFLVPEPVPVISESGRLFCVYFREEFGQKRTLKPLVLEGPSAEIEGSFANLKGVPFANVNGIGLVENVWVDLCFSPGVYTLFVEDLTQFKGNFFENMPAKSLKIELLPSKKVKKNVKK